jgi:hypothetical protein
MTLTCEEDPRAAAPIREVRAEAFFGGFVEDGLLGAKVLFRGEPALATEEDRYKTLVNIDTGSLMLRTSAYLCDSAGEVQRPRRDLAVCGGVGLVLLAPAKDLAGQSLVLSSLPVCHHVLSGLFSCADKWGLTGLDDRIEADRALGICHGPNTQVRCRKCKIDSCTRCMPVQ